MTQGRIDGAIAIVTGASGGIAEGIAKTLAREGARVAVVSRGLERAQRVASEISAAGGGATAIAADVTRAADVRAMVAAVLDAHGRVDILVNGVGGFNGKAPIEDMTEAQWDDVMNLNMKSVFLCAQAVVRSMKDRRSGRIINIGSQSGTAPNPHGISFLPYGAAKAGLVGFTKHLAKELGPHGITVNVVSPGTTVTPRSAKNLGPEGLERVKSHNPMKTLIEPEDTAEAVLFLASDAGRYITGVNLSVNAGTLIM